MNKKGGFLFDLLFGWILKIKKMKKEKDVKDVMEIHETMEEKF